MLVEGPAELFLIPALVQQVMNVNLDALGITVVPIYGVHFDTYAKLFGPGVVTKKCAIVADGDLEPSDSHFAEDDDFPSPPKPNLLDLENNFVKTFVCKTTFERDATAPGTMQMFAEGPRECGDTRISARLVEILTLTEWEMPLSDDAKARLSEARSMVLNTAKRFGKARFAQICARHVELATWVPKYLRNAIEWLTAK